MNANVQRVFRWYLADMIGLRQDEQDVAREDIVRFQSFLTTESIEVHREMRAVLCEPPCPLC